MISDMDALEKEFQYYLENLPALVREHRGRIVVVKDQKVIGVYDDEATAVAETQKKHKLGTFLVQKCEPGSDSYTQTFHSRVAFV